ncbi:hypothetical protein GF312_12110 [Candidatus Poribacteria bacterium]|nr:hypothetical protein [Candidatus Poribacteria bacterium]
MKESELSATQKAVIEKIRVLMREYVITRRPSFLYTQEELLRNIEKDLKSLDEEYIKEYKIPKDVVNNIAREIYDALMKKSQHDRAITLAEHYKI